MFRGLWKISSASQNPDADEPAARLGMAEKIGAQIPRTFDVRCAVRRSGVFPMVHTANTVGQTWNFMCYDSPISVQLSAKFVHHRVLHTVTGCSGCQ